MSAHYYHGAFYPRGGAKRIPAAYIKALRQHGGEIRTSTRVTRIIVKDGDAVGVELEGGASLFASDIVCNADPAITYGKLLPEQYCPAETRKVERTTYSPSLVSLFCAVDMDLRGMGYDSGNYWWYRTSDVEGIYARMEQEMPRDIDALFVAITSLKDQNHRRHGHHTLEMFTFVPYAPFARWRNVAPSERGERYADVKRSLAERMLRAAENVIPNIGRHVKFLDVGTPLTNDFYCETFRGAAYGSAKTPWQLGPFSFGTRGPVDHLYLCGASTLSHGVAGASMSGLMAAQAVLDLGSPEDCLGPSDGSLRIYGAEEDEPAPISHAA